MRSGAPALALVLVLGLALSGCTTPRTTTAPAAATVRPVAEDVGNGRPPVSHDGLMVRRRVVIALHAAPGTDLAVLREPLDRAAAVRHTTLTGVAAGVLDAVVLDRLLPDLVLALPEGATVTDADGLYDAALRGTSDLATLVDRHEIARVLVHDLRFTVDSPDPAGLSAAIGREGILADALGDYTTSVTAAQVVVTYTGPLLSDRLVDAVRRGMSRPAGLAPGAVTLAPRTTTGTGVDLAREPAAAPEPTPTAGTPTHEHAGAATAGAAG